MKTAQRKVPDLGFHFTKEQLRRIACAMIGAKRYMDRHGQGISPRLITNYNHYENSTPLQK